MILKVYGRTRPPRSRAVMWRSFSGYLGKKRYSSNKLCTMHAYTCCSFALPCLNACRRASRWSDVSLPWYTCSGDNPLTKHLTLAMLSVEYHHLARSNMALHMTSLPPLQPVHAALQMHYEMPARFKQVESSTRGKASDAILSCLTHLSQSAALPKEQIDHAESTDLWLN